MSNGIKVVPIEEEMQSAYLDYSMSVIVARALPDVRDGLKPVHRRIIYSMYETNNLHSKPFKKSAKVVGDVMGNYHPHGNVALYETMVRLAQWFSMRLPLVEGQGNFGSMDGDSAAADRYTEARLAKVSEMLVADIDCDTVNFVPNYANFLLEPTVLPARFPNLLVNGSSGIAVGMATYIPTHNLGEVIDACCAVLDNPNIATEELIEKYIPGPDFPTGGIILGRGGIKQAFKTGHGSALVRSKTTITRGINNRETVIVTEIPYQVNKAKLVERIAELIKNKTIEGISDIRDESNKDGVRIVIEIKRDAVAEVVLNQLFRYTPLQVNIPYNMLALVKNKPVRLSLLDIINNFLEFRKEIVIRRCKFKLKQNRAKAHNLIGFCIALTNIDRVISIVKGSNDKNVAKEGLIKENLSVGNMTSLLELIEDPQAKNPFYHFSDTQSGAILEMKLSKLTSLEQDKMRDELQGVMFEIEELLSILGSKQKVLEIIKQELIEVKEQFGTPRLTKIEDNYSEVEDEDLIQKEDVVITYTTEGYIKRVPLDSYRSQRRGGRGKNGMDTKDEDIVKDVITANTHDIILCFSTIGKVYQLKTYKIPSCSTDSKGRAMVNILPLEENETISTILVIPQNVTEENNKTLVFVTSFGNIRRNKFNDFINIQSNGKRAILLDDKEKLINVMLANDDDDIFIATKNGICNRFPVNNVRVFASRSSNGVRGIKLKDNDEVMSTTVLYKWSLDGINEREEYLNNADDLRQMVRNIPDGQTMISNRMLELAKEEKFVATVTDKGFGQVCSFYEYRSTSRGTQGFKNISLSEKNGHVVATFPVDYDDEIIMVTNTGRIMRCNISDIRITHRGAQGVIVFRLDDGELITSVTRVDKYDENNEMSNDNNTVM